MLSPGVVILVELNFLKFTIFNFNFILEISVPLFFVLMSFCGIMLMTNSQFNSVYFDTFTSYNTSFQSILHKQHLGHLESHKINI